MPDPLAGLRIALLESHRSKDAAAHVRRLGGAPYCVPAVREVVHPDRAGALIDRLVSGQLSAVVFMTGPGATVLIEEAARAGRVSETIEALRSTTTVCRGPKPAAVLRRQGLPTGVPVAEPYTTRQVLEALDTIDLRGRRVALVQHREPDGALAAGLSSRGALPEIWAVYESTLPEDLEPLQQMIQEIVQGRVDALALTNRIQVRHLFRVATDLGSAAALTGALNTNVIVGVVGPVCAEALQAFGVPADVIPARPTLESTIDAIAEYFELTRDAPGTEEG